MDDENNIITNPPAVTIPVISPNPLPEGAASTTQKTTTVQENTTSAKHLGSMEVNQTVISNIDYITKLVQAILALSIIGTNIFLAVKSPNTPNTLFVGGFGFVLGFYFKEKFLTTPDTQNNI